MHALADEVQFDDAKPGTRVILKEFHKTPSEAQKIEPRKQELCHEFMKIADERVEEFVEQVAGTLPRIDLLAYFFERPEAPHRVSELAERTGWCVGQIQSASRHVCETGVLEETAEAGEPAFRMTRRREVREVVERFVRSISDPKNCYRIYYRVVVEEKEVIQQV